MDPARLVLPEHELELSGLRGEDIPRRVAHHIGHAEWLQRAARSGPEMEVGHLLGPGPIDVVVRPCGVASECVRSALPSLLVELRPGHELLAAGALGWPERRLPIGAQERVRTVFQVEAGLPALPDSRVPEDAVERLVAVALSTEHRNQPEVLPVAPVE